MDPIVKKKTFLVDKDSFSNGQIESKLWLCQELESLFSSIDKIWIYGGWYGITSFLLNSRNNIDIGVVRSFDVDPVCESVADMINENWVFQNWKFKAFTQDCNLITFDKDTPDLIINTSTEHFDSLDWWNNIPAGTVVALQGNDMPHEDHCVETQNLEDFLSLYPLSETLYQGQKKFVYPEWSFTRFMTIGKK